MEDKFIIELLKAFDTSSAVSLKLQKGDYSISLKKEDAFEKKVVASVTQVAPVNPVVTQVPQVPVTLPVENTASQSSSVSSNTQSEESANVIKVQSLELSTEHHPLMLLCIAKWENLSKKDNLFVF